MSPREPWQDYEEVGPAGRAAKVTAILRGLGLLAIVFAFFVVSQQFLAGENAGQRAGNAKVAIYADASLRELGPQLAPGAAFTFGDSAELASRIRDGAPADLFLSAGTASATSLVDAGRCEAPTPLATREPVGAAAPTDYVACLVNRAGTDREAAGETVDELTGLRARNLLLEAGLAIPAER